jgi:hypothetical protein
MGREDVDTVAEDTTPTDLPFSKEYVGVVFVVVRESVGLGEVSFSLRFRNELKRLCEEVIFSLRDGQSDDPMSWKKKSIMFVGRGSGQLYSLNTSTSNFDTAFGLI